MFIAPRWALLSPTPRPEESRLKFIGAWLGSAREKSEKPNPWLRWPTACGLLQATGGRTVLKGWVPTVGCHDQSAHPLPAHVPVPLRMSLSQRAHGTKPEAATLLSHIQLSTWYENFYCGCGTAFYVFGITKHIGHRMICLDQVLRDTK